MPRSRRCLDAPHPLTPAQMWRQTWTHSVHMGSADSPRRPPTAGPTRLDAMGCVLPAALGSCCLDGKLGLEWTTRWGWGCSEPVDEGLLTLSALSVRRCRRLDVLSNSLACVERGGAHAPGSSPMECWRTWRSRSTWSCGAGGISPTEADRPARPCASSSRSAAELMPSCWGRV